MAVYKTTELVQLWKHTSGQVISLDAIAPLIKKEGTAEYNYESQGCSIGSESELEAIGWSKIDESEYIGPVKSSMPITQEELGDVDKGWD